MFRYQYLATISKSSKDDNGDPVDGESESFYCDYQPSSNNASITVAGASIPISYILFVPKDCTVIFEKGNDILCNGDSGSVVLSIPYRFGKMIYVRG